MKRGGFLRRRKRLRPVSDKVRKGKPAFDAVYDAVDERSGMRCEVVITAPDKLVSVNGVRFALKPLVFQGRCNSAAIEHHHTRKPRRAYHRLAFVIHVCRYHHDMATASYRNGRLLIEPNGDGTFACRVVTKASKFSPEGQQ